MTPEPPGVARRRREQRLYHGADLSRAQRFSVAAWIFGMLVGVVITVGYPPSGHGPVGWLVLCLLCLLCVVAATGAALRRVGFRIVLTQQYTAAVGLAALQWAAGGWHAPYQQLIGALMVFVSFVHPRTRAMPLVALCTALVLLPATYGDARPYAVPVLVDLLVWVGIAAFANGLMRTVRRQRAELAAWADAARADARRDSLTGLLNRRAFMETVTGELSDSRAQGLVLSLAVGDIDDFKGVNDDFGHPEGDACLVAVARALERVVRPPDRVFRWGGDEFVVLLRGASAAVACARLEDAVAGAVRTPDGRSVAVSFGVVLDDGTGGPDDLVAAADSALLVRKRERTVHGRDALVAQRAADRLS